MSLMQEFSSSCVHWALGISVLSALTTSEFSGAATILAIPITVISITISALSNSALPANNENTYKKRKLCDILDFFQIWSEILELLAASATCARIASATVDYISHERLRDWFLGLQSHSLGEPWPDILGLAILIVITGLFMLGLEKSTSLSALFFITIFTTFLFFVVVGSLHTVGNAAKLGEDLMNCPLQSVLMAASACSYGFVNTFPKMGNYKSLKIAAMVIIPIFFYTAMVIVFTLMFQYKELAGSATPLIRVFELRDVDWARLAMTICIICTVCLALTEVLPSLFGLFVTLASKEWQIFLISLQHKNSVTGAPLLAIFAAGSLAAILAFACPLTYLIKILNAATLIKLIVKAFQVLYFHYRPKFRNGNYLVNSPTTHYSKLKQLKKHKEDNVNIKNKVVGIFNGWSKNPSSIAATSKKNRKKKANTSQDDEYLLMTDYCDKSSDLTLNESSDENDEEESVLSDNSCSSTDIDAAVEEYKEKVQVATIDNFNEKYATYVTATTVIIFLVIIVTTTICLSQVIVWKLYNLMWPCFTVLFFSMAIILVMPKNLCCTNDGLLPKSLTPLFSLISLELNIILVANIIEDIWPGFIFWFCAGCLLLWRCECCTCEGLLTRNQNNILNITENIAQYPDKYVDTILIAR